MKLCYDCYVISHFSLFLEEKIQIFSFNLTASRLALECFFRNEQMLRWLVLQVYKNYLDNIPGMIVYISQITKNFLVLLILFGAVANWYLVILTFTEYICRILILKYSYFSIQCCLMCDGSLSKLNLSIPMIIRRATIKKSRGDWQWVPAVPASLG